MRLILYNAEASIKMSFMNAGKDTDANTVMRIKENVL